MSRLRLPSTPYSESARKTERRMPVGYNRSLTA